MSLISFAFLMGGLTTYMERPATQALCPKKRSTGTMPWLLDCNYRVIL